MDCYDAKGNLLPDESKAFGGFTVSCAPGMTAKPTASRLSIPVKMRLRVESIEACQKKASGLGKAEFEKCDAAYKAEREAAQ